MAGIVMGSVSVQSSHGVPVTGAHHHHEPRSERLVVMLPGRRYYCDRPPFDYLRLAALQRGWDVLMLPYVFQVAPIDDSQFTFADVQADLQVMLDEVLRTGPAYREALFVGKSLGTPLALDLAAAWASDVARPARAVLLTPIPEALERLGKVPALVALGDADPVYAMPQYAVARQAAQTEWLLLPGVDHGLEVAGDWAAMAQSHAAVVRMVAERLL